MELQIFYFDTKHAIEVHDWIIDKSGGLHGYREIGLLDSALEHIQNDDYYPTFEEKLKHLVIAGKNVVIQCCLNSLHFKRCQKAVINSLFE